MKILRLNLQAFGPFTNAALDLSAGRHGLHVIYGPNEAGKTSALRALRQMLYGIPERSTDDFVWPYPRLRIGAVVRHSDGTEVAFVRRKGRKNTIRKATDDSPLPDDCLERFLGNLDVDLFATMFGIGHETLVEGGRQIAEGGGHFGEMLFAASAGLADLRGVQERLKRDMDALFLPKGENPTINKCLSDLHEVQANVRKLQLSSDEWRRHEEGFRKAREKRKELEEQWQKQNRELNRLTRIRDALPLVAERKQLLDELVSHRGAVASSDNFCNQGWAKMDAVHQTQLERGQAAEDQAAVEKQSSRLDVPVALLAQAEAVEALHQRVGEYRKHRRDLPRRRDQMKKLEHDAKDILQSLGRPPDVEQAGQLRLRRDEPVKIQNLGNRQQALVDQQRNTAESAKNWKDALAIAQRELEKTPDPPDGTELRSALRQAQAIGNAEGNLDTRSKDLEKATDQVTVELARLPYWIGSLAELERLPVPLSGTVDRFETLLNELKSHLSALDGRHRDRKEEIEKSDLELRQLELQQEVPTEDDLREARGRREEGWRLVLRAWRGGEDTEAIAAIVAESAPGGDLAQAYEATVRRADEAADCLRRDADRVAQKVNLLAQGDQCREQLEVLERERKGAYDRQENLMRDWIAAVQSLPLPGPTPSDVRAWVRQQNNLVLRAQAIREEGKGIEQFRSVIAAHRVQLGGCLQRLGEPGPHDSETLAALIERSQGVLDQMNDLRRRREQLAKDVDVHEKQLTAAETTARQAEEELAGWQEKWATAMKRLGLEAIAPPEAANAFLAGITELFQKLYEADGYRRRIKGMKRDIRKFQKDLRDLTQRIAPDLAAVPAKRATEELYLRLGQARTAQQERKGLAENLDRCEASLRAFSAGATVEEFVAEAEQTDADLLPGEIGTITEQIAKLQGEIGVVNQTIGAEARELERMDGSAAAAEAAEEAETLLAQLQTGVPHYAALRLAAVVLQKGIERYREKNQGPVLAGASRRFADLTCGSFGGPRTDGKSDEIGALRIDYDDAGAAVLVGVRPGGQETVGVEGMSDGSRDQLYLALRLASLETWLESHEPIPFIVDDVLLNFDDERATAVLKSFADLSRRTQIIFFTHHEHIVRLARGCLAEDTLFIHRLPDRPQQRTVVQVM